MDLHFLSLQGNVVGYRNNINTSAIQSETGILMTTDGRRIRFHSTVKNCGEKSKSIGSTELPNYIAKIKYSFYDIQAKVFISLVKKKDKSYGFIAIRPVEKKFLPMENNTYSPPDIRQESFGTTPRTARTTPRTANSTTTTAISNNNIIQINMNMNNLNNNNNNNNDQNSIGSHSFDSQSYNSLGNNSFDTYGNNSNNSNNNNNNNINNHINNMDEISHFTSSTMTSQYCNLEGVEWKWVCDITCMSVGGDEEEELKEGFDICSACYNPFMGQIILSVHIPKTGLSRLQFYSIRELTSNVNYGLNKIRVIKAKSFIVTISLKTKRKGARPIIKALCIDPIKNILYGSYLNSIVTWDGLTGCKLYEINKLTVSDILKISIKPGSDMLCTIQAFEERVGDTQIVLHGVDIWNIDGVTGQVIANFRIEKKCKVVTATLLSSTGLGNKKNENEETNFNLYLIDMNSRIEMYSVNSNLRSAVCISKFKLSKNHYDSALEVSPRSTGTSSSSTTAMGRGGGTASTNGSRSREIISKKSSRGSISDSDEGSVTRKRNSRKSIKKKNSNISSDVKITMKPSFANVLIYEASDKIVRIAVAMGSQTAIFRLHTNCLQNTIFNAPGEIISGSFSLLPELYNDMSPSNNMKSVVVSLCKYPHGLDMICGHTGKITSSIELDSDDPFHGLKEKVYPTSVMHSHLLQLTMVGWSNGRIDVYDMETRTRIAVLQTNDNNSRVTSVTGFPGYFISTPINANQNSNDKKSKSKNGKKINNRKNSKKQNDNSNDDIKQPVSSTDRCIAAGSESGKIFIWSIALNGAVTILHTSQAHTADVKTITPRYVELDILKAEELKRPFCLVSVGKDGEVKCWGPQTSNALYQHKDPLDTWTFRGFFNVAKMHNYISSMTIISEYFAAIGFDDGLMEIWELPYGTDSLSTIRECHESIKIHKSRVTSIVSTTLNFSTTLSKNDNKKKTNPLTILTCGEDHHVVQWYFDGINLRAVRQFTLAGEPRIAFAVPVYGIKHVPYIFGNEMSGNGKKEMLWNIIVGVHNFFTILDTFTIEELQTRQEIKMAHMSDGSINWKIPDSHILDLSTVQKKIDFTPVANVKTHILCAANVIQEKTIENRSLDLFRKVETFRKSIKIPEEIAFDTNYASKYDPNVELTPVIVQPVTRNQCGVAYDYKPSSPRIGNTLKQILESPSKRDIYSSSGTTDNLMTTATFEFDKKCEYVKPPPHPKKNAFIEIEEPEGKQKVFGELSVDFTQNKEKDIGFFMSGINSDLITSTLDKLSPEQKEILRQKMNEMMISLPSGINLRKMSDEVASSLDSLGKASDTVQEVLDHYNKILETIDRPQFHIDMSFQITNFMNLVGVGIGFPYGHYEKNLELSLSRASRDKKKADKAFAIFKQEIKDKLSGKIKMKKQAYTMGKVGAKEHNTDDPDIFLMLDCDNSIVRPKSTRSSKIPDGFGKDEDEDDTTLGVPSRKVEYPVVNPKLDELKGIFAGLGPDKKGNITIEQMLEWKRIHQHIHSTHISRQDVKMLLEVVSDGKTNKITFKDFQKFAEAFEEFVGEVKNPPVITSNITETSWNSVAGSTSTDRGGKIYISLLQSDHPPPEVEQIKDESFVGERPTLVYEVKPHTTIQYSFKKLKPGNLYTIYFYSEHPLGEVHDDGSIDSAGNTNEDILKYKLEFQTEEMPVGALPPILGIWKEIKENMRNAEVLAACKHRKLIPKFLEKNLQLISPDDLKLNNQAGKQKMRDFEKFYSDPENVNFRKEWIIYEFIGAIDDPEMIKKMKEDEISITKEDLESFNFQELESYRNFHLGITGRPSDVSDDDKLESLKTVYLFFIWYFEGSCKRLDTATDDILEEAKVTQEEYRSIFLEKHVNIVQEVWDNVISLYDTYSSFLRSKKFNRKKRLWKMSQAELEYEMRLKKFESLLENAGFKYKDKPTYIDIANSYIFEPVAPEEFLPDPAPEPQEGPPVAELWIKSVMRMTTEELYLELRIACMIPEVISVAIEDGIDIPDIEDCNSICDFRNERFNRFHDWYILEETVYEEIWYTSKDPEQLKDIRKLSLAREIFLSSEAEHAVKDIKIQEELKKCPKCDIGDDGLATLLKIDKASDREFYEFRIQYINNLTIRKLYLSNQINRMLNIRRARLCGAFLTTDLSNVCGPLFLQYPKIAKTPIPYREKRVRLFPSRDPETYIWAEILEWYKDEELVPDDEGQRHAEKLARDREKRENWKEKEKEREKLEQIMLRWEDRRSEMMIISENQLAILEAEKIAEKTIKSNFAPDLPATSIDDFEYKMAIAMEENAFPLGCGLDNTDEGDDEIERAKEAAEKARLKKLENKKKREEERAKKREEERKKKLEEERLRTLEERNEKRRRVEAHLKDLKRKREAEKEAARRQAEEDARNEELNREEERLNQIRIRAHRKGDLIREQEQEALVKSQQLNEEKAKEARELAGMRLEDMHSSQVRKEENDIIEERNARINFFKYVYMPYDSFYKDDMNPTLWKGPKNYRPRTMRRHVDQYCLPAAESILDDVPNSLNYYVCDRSEFKNNSLIPRKPLTAITSLSCCGPEDIRKRKIEDSDEILTGLRIARTADPLLADPQSKLSAPWLICDDFLTITQKRKRDNNYDYNERERTQTPLDINNNNIYKPYRSTTTSTSFSTTTTEGDGSPEKKNQRLLSPLHRSSSSSISRNDHQSSIGGLNDRSIDFGNYFFGKSFDETILKKKRLLDSLSAKINQKYQQQPFSELNTPLPYIRPNMKGVKGERIELLDRPVYKDLLPSPKARSKTANQRLLSDDGDGNGNGNYAGEEEVYFKRYNHTTAYIPPSTAQTAHTSNTA